MGFDALHLHSTTAEPVQLSTAPSLVWNSQPRFVTAENDGI